MPASGPRLSDAYVLRYLLQQASAPNSHLVWRQDEADGGFIASTGTVRLRMELVAGRSGSQTVLSLGNEEDSVDILEPHSVSFFGSQYATPEEAEVAQLLRSLFAAVRSQASRNEQASEERFDARKQNIFRQLLFGRPEPG